MWRAKGRDRGEDMHYYVPIFESQPSNSGTVSNLNTLEPEERLAGGGNAKVERGACPGDRRNPTLAELKSNHNLYNVVFVVFVHIVGPLKLFEGQSMGNQPTGVDYSALLQVDHGSDRGDWVLGEAASRGDNRRLALHQELVVNGRS